MIAQAVQVTNTLNITLILAVISAVSIGGSAAVYVIFKLVRQIQRQLFELQLQAIKDAKALMEATHAGAARLEECIHKIPGHPDGQLNVQWQSTDRQEPGAQEQKET